MIRAIDLYQEPIEILNKFENRGYAGMSDFELTFLCGMIKKTRPKKIVEVGVAAGGTTAVILNCLKLLNCNCEMYSVDICEKCYLDISKRTGFIAEEVLQAKDIDVVRHEFILGTTIAAALEKIGGAIDFVILDTMHSLPGELLDFISIYHSLDKEAVIVFHDMGQSQLGIGHINGAPWEYASLVTMTTLSGEKYFVTDDSRIACLSNIGAIKLNEETPNSIDSLFMALFINWNYIPDNMSLNEYRVRIKAEYDAKYYNMFEQALECNTFSLYRQKKLIISLQTIKCEFERILDKAEKVYIYGAGILGRKVKTYIERYLDRNIEGYIVSGKNLNESAHIIELSELENVEHSIIVLGLDEKYHLEVLDNLYQKGLARYVFPYNGIGFRELMEVIEYENIMRENIESYENTYGYDIAIRRGYKNK